MLKMKLLLTTSLLAALVVCVHSASDPRALNLVKLVADVLYKAPANNDFVYMVEHKMMDNGIANIIEGMAPRFARPGACTQFQASGPGKLSVGPVQRREEKRGADEDLQKSVLSILDSAEGMKIMNEGMSGSMKVPPPRYASGGLGLGRGRRGVDIASSVQKDVLSILDGTEGQHVMDDKVAGKDLHIPSPRYNSGGLRNNLGRKKRASTSQHNIASGQHAGFANKASALLARVRNICVNKASLRLFLTALDDGTVRAAMYNVCQCNAIASTIRYLYNTGV